MTIDRLPLAFAETLATFARATNQTPVRVLDASCHEGHVLRRLGQLWECPTFGCEPSEAVHAARLGTTRVVREAFLNVRISRHGVSAALGIVPHTAKALEDEDHLAFGRKLLDSVMAGGLVAPVVPLPALDRRLYALIAGWVTALQAYDLTQIGLPDIVALIGVKRWTRDDAKPSPDSLKRIQAGQIPAFAPAPQPLTSLPRVDGEFQFDPQYLRYDVAAKEARAYGVWADPIFEPVLLTPSTRRMQPTMTLRKGHLADLVVGGIFENILIERGVQHLLVKGQTVKERTETQEGNLTQAIERFRPVVTVLDLRTGESRTLMGGD
jgi:hypothetical protein